MFAIYLDTNIFSAKFVNVIRPLNLKCYKIKSKFEKLSFLSFSYKTFSKFTNKSHLFDLEKNQ